MDVFGLAGGLCHRAAAVYCLQKAGSGGHYWDLYGLSGMLQRVLYLELDLQDLPGETADLVQARGRDYSVRDLL